MKLLLTGDWHLRYKRPEMRLDENYFEIQAGKVEQILQIAQQEKCGVILQPGDFFDGVETPWFVVQYYMKLFMEYEIPVICSPGQHDLKYHTREIENTPLGILEASDIAGLHELVDYHGGPFIYCVRWGQMNIPDVVRTGNGDPDSVCHILLMHRMVVQKKLWLKQTDFVYARDLLKDHPDFDLFVTGDNHQSFAEEDGGRYVVNCGSLMRSSIDQVDHKPIVYVYDTDDGDLKPIPLDVRPSSEVLNIDQAQIQKDRDKKLELFITTLKKKGRDTGGYDFTDKLYELMKGVDPETREIIEEAMK